MQIYKIKSNKQVLFKIITIKQHKLNLKMCLIHVLITIKTFFSRYLKFN